MTQEEKQLLIKDLCARVPYGVMFDRLGHPKKILAIWPNSAFPIQCDNGEYVANTYTLEDGKPYLRPMSSMTEEEAAFVYNGHIEFWIREDYCNKHHLDYWGLIEKGLALEAPKDMYKIE